MNKKEELIERKKEYEKKLKKCKKITKFYEFMEKTRFSGYKMGNHSIYSMLCCFSVLASLAIPALAVFLAGIPLWLGGIGIVLGLGSVFGATKIYDKIDLDNTLNKTIYETKLKETEEEFKKASELTLEIEKTKNSDNMDRRLVKEIINKNSSVISAEDQTEVIKTFDKKEAQELPDELDELKII